jgi:hypothetical protein
MTATTDEATLPAPDLRRCWICRAVVAPDEPTIAPTVCARCFDELVRCWR